MERWCFCSRTISLTTRFFLAYFCLVRIVSGQIETFTPPPRTPDNKPIEANGIIYYLDYIPRRCQNPYVKTFPSGGIVDRPMALMKRDSPHRIRKSIEISPTGCLFIEPGCRLEFAPGEGIIVNGTLIARGSEEPGGRITFTKDPNFKVKPTDTWRNDARLVDGNSTMDGRFELFYKNKWRGVCTNYINFTEAEANVTCRHLGFRNGNFTYHSFSYNLTDYLLFERPKCVGQENSLTECPGWLDIKIGPHVCDDQQTIGFECEGLRPGLAIDHWRGIEFYNSSTEYYINQITSTKWNASDSSIWYADIEYAGLDIFREGSVGIYHPCASLSASPYVPNLDNVTIRHGAYDALNFTYILGNITVQNSTIYNNRGHGMLIKSTLGQVMVTKTNIMNNWGDGIKYYTVNLTTQANYDTMFARPYFFCRLPKTGIRRYPMYVPEQIVHEKDDVAVPGCDQVFETSEGNVLTLHFIFLEAAPEVKGELVVSNPGGDVIQTVPIKNGSYPQSITSATSKLYINFILRKRGYCRHYKCMRFMLLLTSGKSTDVELHVTESVLSGNNHHGISVQDMRSKIIVNSTNINNNNYEAGLRVFQGAGHVVVNGTVFKNNSRAGVNVTYSGGLLLFNQSQFIQNQGYGAFTEFLLQNRSRIEDGLKFDVVNVKFLENIWTALRIGNYCRDGNILVNESNFESNFQQGIEYLSCNISINTKMNFSLDLNTFKSNVKHGLLMAPLLNTVGRITNNTFVNHFLGGILINNGDDLLISRWYTNFPVAYEIYSNTFSHNDGRYAINMRLTQNSPLQEILFQYNELNNNQINDSFPFLNPRSHANAVIIVSSNNIKVQRNLISNPGSVREMSTQLIDPSVVINAEDNYWGTSEYQNFLNLIFDRDDRYNLAKIKYDPALKNDKLYRDDRIQFSPPDIPFMHNDVLGGELNMHLTLEEKRYRVDKDIYIDPHGRLDIPPGAVLEFDNSIGIVVYGTLVADGQQKKWVEFLLQDDFESVVENMTFPVRLADGKDALEGRVEVEINGKWGTICNKGWTDQNSMVVCSQMGLVYNPQFGQAEWKQKTTYLDIVMNWVMCDPEDTDITKCKAQLETDDPISCTHEEDVYLRCQLATWSGVTIPAIPKGRSSKETQIRTVKIDKAGLLDHSKMFFSPALRIDYNYYDITNVTVTKSSSDGIYIKFNHPYSNNRLQSCNVFDSLGNGLVVKYPFLETAYGQYSRNKQTGFLYDPFFSEVEAMSVQNFMRHDQVTYLKESEYQIKNEMTLFKTAPGMYNNNKTYVYRLESTESRAQLTLQILNYNPLTSVESLTISNGKNEYKIEDDLIDFPLISPRGVFTIKLSISGFLSGRLTFVVIKGGSVQIHPRIHMRNCTVAQNEVGIVTKHYNHQSNDKQELYFRFRDEKIELYFLIVQNNIKEAMHVPSVTKYHGNFIPTYEELTKPQRVGTISYQIKDCMITNNGRGIFAEHNHVDFANNVWHWNISSSKVINNQEGGLEIELPRVNDLKERMYHKVVLIDTLFKSNRDYSCKIQGYYAEILISRNVWRNNNCKLGLLDITGMEKNISISANNFIENICKYVMDLDITSHFEYFDPVKGNFVYNNIKDNGLASSLDSSNIYPSTYALALKGLQDIVVNRNLFHNPNLQYEVVAGVMALSLNNVIDVTKNWWGSVNQIRIQERIFDFDSWNNYARAEYVPFLVEGKFESKLSTQPRLYISPTGRELFGRIEKNMFLFPSDKPYEVISDVTIMPGATLKIVPGTVLHFRPNVGILVLGTLDARGLVNNRIKMLPSPAPISQGLPIVKRSAVLEKVRFRGSPNKNEGFLEFFNSTSNKWNIMCDNKFNKKIAEVVCRQLGFETINVRVRFSHLYDYFIYGFTTYFTKEFWAYTYHCTGEEVSLDKCTKRINYRLMGCIHNESYTFIQCGKRNLEAMYNYWGNIRFSLSTYEEPLWDENNEQSYLEYTDIHGAGILHGKKVGAIQAVYRTPVIRYVNISGCALNGYDFIAPRHDLTIENQNISKNLGYAVNILVLNGDSRKGQDSTFVPLIESTIPYYLFGLVEICRMEREITLDTRMLLYFKYSSQAVNCIKSIRSNNKHKTIELRFLQMNLYSEDFTRNVIEIFDGKKQIVELFANSSKTEILKLYSSTAPNALTVHIHTSAADKEYGFIAEVVNEMFGTSSQSKNKHLIKNAAMEKNEDGAIQYKNVGEVNPALYIQSCSVTGNGVSMLNMTSPPVNKISLQMSRKMVMSNNFFSHNKGGTWIHLETNSVSTAIEANITNNVFTYGSHGETLIISGHYYQVVFMRGNFIFNNFAGDYKNVILMQDIKMMFTSNHVSKNTGHYIIAAYASEKIESSQLLTKNNLKDNNSTALHESTIKVGSGMPRFVNNYLVNPDNAYELESNDITKFYGRKPINATENWWGSVEQWYIEGKVRDDKNNKSLAPVLYTPYKISASAFTEGECPVGWSLDNSRCYRYFGGVQNYYDALKFCTDLGGNLGAAKDKEYFFQKLIIESDNYYEITKRVWVYMPLSPHLCSAFLDDFISIENDCSNLLYPFVCEIDPVITAASMDLAVIISSTVFSILIVLILIISGFWIFKSKQRKEERFERRNSLRSSIRSRSQLTMLSSHPSRLNYLDSRSNISDNYIIGHHPVDGTSMVSVEKSKNNSFITDATEITMDSTLGRNHNKINNNIHMVDYDEFEPSFTEDEDSITSDIQTEPNTRIHSNIDLINALKDEKSKSVDVIYSNVPFNNQNRKMSKNSLNSEVPSEPFANDQRPILSSKNKNPATMDKPPSPPPPLEDYKPSKRLLNMKKNINKYPITSKSSSLEGIPGQGLGEEIRQNPQPKDPYHQRLAENREPSPVLSVKSRGSQGNISDIFAVADSCIPPPSKLSTFPSQDSLSHTNKPSHQRYYDYADSQSEDLDPGIGYMQRNTFDRSSQDRIDVDYLNSRSKSPYSANFRSSRENLDSLTAKPKPMPRQVTPSHSSQENLDGDRYYQPSPRGSQDDLQDTGTSYMPRPPVAQKPPKAQKPKPSRHPPQKIDYLETEIF